jgi:hypothetical protein
MNRKRTIHAVRGISFVALFLVAGTLLHAQAPPSQDGFVSAAKPNTNYESNSPGSLAVQGSGSTSFVQFNLSSIPTNTTANLINKASLRLFVSGFTAAGTFDIYLVSSGWNENTVTYASAPTLGAIVASGISVPATAKNNFIEVDITSALQAWVGGSQKNNGVALVPSPLSTISATFSSKEDTTVSHEPELLFSLGSAGTVNSVGSGSGLTGGPITSSGTLSIATGGVTNAMLQNPSLTITPGMGLSGGGPVSLGGNTSIGLTTSCSSNQVLQWNGSAWTCTTAGIGTITGVTAGTDLTGGGASGNITLNLDATKVPLLATNNAFTGTQSFAATFAGPLLRSVNTNNSGTGVYGQTAAPSGLIVTNAAVLGDSSITYGVYGASSTLGGIYGTTSAPGWAGVTGVGITNGVSGSGSGNGVVGTSGAGTGVFGQTSGSSGLANGAAAVLGDSHNYFGVWGTSANNDGVRGNCSGTDCSGASGFNSGTGYGLYGAATGSAGIGVYGESFGTGGAHNSGPDGVHGVSHSGNGSGVAGINDGQGGTGVFGSSTNGGWGFNTDSNTTQTRNMGGWVKAMVFVDPFAPGGIAITRCYNSQATPDQATNVAANPPCGLSVTHVGQGHNLIDFGFQVSDRFISTTNVSSGVMFACVSNPNNGCSYTSITLVNGFPVPEDINATANQVITSTVEPGGQPVDSAFWVIVF